MMAVFFREGITYTSAFKREKYNINCRAGTYEICNRDYYDKLDSRGADTLLLKDNAYQYCTHQIVEVKKNHGGEWLFMGRLPRGIRVAIYAKGDFVPGGSGGFVDLDIYLIGVSGQMAASNPTLMTYVCGN